MDPGVPPLTDSQRQLLHEGILCFNREQFFECHEVLEAAWLEACGAQKKFLQGLIQVAVAFYHLRRGNFIGAERLLDAGMMKLSAFPPEQESVDLGGLLAELRTLRQKIEAGNLAPDSAVPRIAGQPWKSTSVASSES